MPWAALCHLSKRGRAEIICNYPAKTGEALKNPKKNTNPPSRAGLPTFRLFAFLDKLLFFLTKLTDTVTLPDFVANYSILASFLEGNYKGITEPRQRILHLAQSALQTGVDLSQRLTSSVAAGPPGRSPGLSFFGGAVTTP